MCFAYSEVFFAHSHFFNRYKVKSSFKVSKFRLIELWVNIGSNQKNLDCYSYCLQIHQGCSRANFPSLKPTVTCRWLTEWNCVFTFQFLWHTLDSEQHEEQLFSICSHGQTIIETHRPQNIPSNDGILRAFVFNSIVQGWKSKSTHINQPFYEAELFGFLILSSHVGSTQSVKHM